jgi:hypothetical protein
MLGSEAIHKRSNFRGQAWWYMPKIPSTWEAEVGMRGLQFKASPGKILARLHLNQLARHGARL